MDWQTVERNWPAFVEQVTQRWTKTDETDLLDIDGDRDRFATYLARTHDLTANEAHEEIDAWLMGEMPSDVKMDDFRDNANIRESGAHIPPGEDVYSEDGDFGDDNVPQRPVGRTS